MNVPVRRVEGGLLSVPARAEGPDGVVGDGLMVIGPGDPDYADWLALMEWLEAEGYA